MSPRSQSSLDTPRQHPRAKFTLGGGGRSNMSIDVAQGRVLTSITPGKCLFTQPHPKLFHGFIQKPQLSRWHSSTQTVVSHHVLGQPKYVNRSESHNSRTTPVHWELSISCRSADGRGFAEPHTYLIGYVIAYSAFFPRHSKITLRGQPQK